LYAQSKVANSGGRWHGDIKPENILFVQGKYKLSDPGEARIRRETTIENRVHPPRAIANGGTRTYGMSLTLSLGTIKILITLSSCTGEGDLPK
jgi:serine/threonine protein kinase